MPKTKDQRLNELQEQHRRLLAEKLPLVQAYKESARETDRRRRPVEAISKKIKLIGEQIFQLKHDGPTPHVTDHAIVRYLERIEGLDLSSVKLKIAEHKDAVREGNVIVTVNQNIEDLLEEQDGNTK